MKVFKIIILNDNVVNGIEQYGNVKCDVKENSKGFKNIHKIPIMLISKENVSSI